MSSRGNAAMGIETHLALAVVESTSYTLLTILGFADPEEREFLCNIPTTISGRFFITINKLRSFDRVPDQSSLSAFPTRTTYPAVC